MIFVYRALDEQGSLQRGYEECDNARNLKKILEEKGWKLLSVHKYWRRFLKTRKKCRKELQGFFIGLSQLLKQKITLRDALSILSLDKDLQPITQRLSEDIRQGLCFSQALQAQRFFFPNFAILHIKNAEVTSSLEDGCLKVGQFFELQELFSEKKRQALTYPLFVGTVSLAFLGLLFRFLIPQIRSFIGDNANFSFTQRILFFVSDLVQKIGETEIMVGVIGISLFFFFRKRKAETLETKYDAVLWLSGLSLLLKSGITTKQSFVFSEQIILNSPLKKHIHGLIEQVLKGVSLPHLLAQTPGLPKSAAKFAEIGESCGALGDLLEQCSQIEIQTLLAQTKRRLALLQPALLLSIGFILVVILASLFPALYDGAFSSLQGAYGP